MATRSPQARSVRFPRVTQETSAPSVSSTVNWRPKLATTVPDRVGTGDFLPARLKA
jgi:hypothetical protein